MIDDAPFLLLMPSYNQAQYIGDAIRSVLGQDDPRWELWIVDNSTDGTPAVVGEFTDPRIRFHHIPDRMDPGSCLNWMLDRAVGRHFSYVHSDNNLGPSYVRVMRAALEAHPLALAYCDLRVIDQYGRYKSVRRRGPFDLARLLSLDTLGVPFAATTELAKKTGGFSVADLADDVQFCVGAYGWAHYIYLREPLIDYRLHANSRTEVAGGDGQIAQIFTRLLPRIARALEQRGVGPLAAMERTIKDGLDDMDLFVEDHWYRRLARRARPWWRGAPRVDHFFRRGLLNVPGFSSRTGRPPRALIVRDDSGVVRAPPWSVWVIRNRFRKYRREFERLAQRPRDVLPIWAIVKLDLKSDAVIDVRLMSADFRTVWAARHLESQLGWRPVWDATVQDPPKWTRWGRARGDEPHLDFSGDLILSAN